MCCFGVQLGCNALAKPCLSALQCICLHLVSTDFITPKTVRKIDISCGLPLCDFLLKQNLESSSHFHAMQAGYCVLVHSAAGGCGLNALAICLAMGAVPIGTVGSQDKVSTLLLSPIAAPFDLPEHTGQLV